MMTGRSVSPIAALAVASLALGFVFVGCGDSRPPRGLVLVVVDTLRADHLGAYGYGRPTSPNIDALAEDAVLFRDAVSPAPWTLPSLATLMTSLYPSVHGAHSPSDLQNLAWLFNPGNFQAFSSLHESRTTLAEVLRDAGFATFGAVQGSYPTSVFGMGQGFDIYRQNLTPGVRFDVEDALAWLDDEQPDRFFVYLHVMEVHAPYMAPAIKPGSERKLDPGRMAYYEEAIGEESRRFLETDFDPDYRGTVNGSRADLRARAHAPDELSPADREHLVALYDRGIVYADHWIGVLLDGLRERGLLDDVVFVLTADHGEEFVEHGRLEHSFSFYEEMLHVPLIVRVPGEGRGVVVEETAGLVDVMPTVVGVLGVPGSEGMQGRDLRSAWQAPGREKRAPDYLGEASLHRRDRALRGPGFKYIRRDDGAGAVREELYDLAVDPGEKRNRCRQAPQACLAHRRRLAAVLAAQRERASAMAAPEPAEIDDDTRESLRALGYIE